MLFIGPNDLALSLLGYVPAKGDEPEFRDAIRKIVTAARRYGKWVARLSNNGSEAKKHLALFDTVALGYDIRAIQNWYSAELEVAREGSDTTMSSQNTDSAYSSADSVEATI